MPWTKVTKLANGIGVIVEGVVGTDRHGLDDLPQDAQIEDVEVHQLVCNILRMNSQHWVCI